MPGVAWSGSSSPPAGTTAVTVSTGSTTTGIDASLATAGAISGTVTAAADGSDLAYVVVEVFSGGNEVATATTSTDGTYSVPGLAAGASYTVCFDAQGAAGGSSTTGYGDQCYNGIAWNGASTLPTGTTAVTVSTGTATTGINASLPSNP